jgi:two-component sensor histidine kinase
MQSSGISNIITKLPYLLEISISTEMILFSIALAARIKYLQQQKQETDALLISQQQSETVRLEKIVHERTGELQSALSQREILLRELHHRVKNNLQMIVSLLRLQSDAIPENIIKEKFKEAESRIQAMSKVHELLYAQEDFTRIDVNLYLHELTDELHQTHPNPDLIEISVSGELQLPMDKAIYLGIVVNELIQNAFKHAFGDRGGNII